MNYELNKIEGFDPEAYVEASKGRRGEELLKKDGTPLKYLSTAAKIVWFRKVCPKGAIIVSEVTDTPAKDFGDIIRYKASVYLDVNDTRPVAEWQHQETCWDIADMDNIVSKVQTIAVGKALSRAGFGCEIELALGALSEGESADNEPTAEKPEEPPKKKRGRPKKEKADAEKEIEDILKSVEAEIGTPAEEPAEESKEEPDKMRQALDTKLVCTDAAPVNIRKFEGQTLESVIEQHPTFCTLVKTRPNIRASVSDECAEAAIYIAEH